MRVPDRQKQRQEYVSKKTGAVGDGLWAGLTATLSAALTVVLFGGGLLSCFFPLTHTAEETGTHPVVGLIGGIVFLILSVFAGRFTFSSIRYSQERFNSASLLPYVAPVTPDTLSAEEILVRGAQEPTQEQSTVLLRAAGESADKPEQLLRASHPSDKN